jgi:integrase
MERAEETAQRKPENRKLRSVAPTTQRGASNRSIYERVRVLADGTTQQVGANRSAAQTRYAVIVTWRGKQYRRYAPTLAAARDVRDKLEERLGKGLEPSSSPILFAAYADSWIETYEGKNGDLRAETKLEYRGEIELAKQFFDRRTLVSITADDAKAYLKHVRETRGRPKRDKDGNVISRQPAKASTMRNAIAPLRAMFFSAMASVRTTQTESNPFSRLGIADKHAEAKATDKAAVEALEDDAQPKAKVFTHAQLGRVLSELRSPAGEDFRRSARMPWPANYWALLGEFLAQTGLRISEAVALQWRDVTFDDGHPFIRVNRRLYRSPDKTGRRVATVSAPKSRYSRRKVPLSPGMAAKLQELRTSRPAAKASDPVFCSQIGGYLSPTNIYNRHFNPAFKRARVDWAGFHTFRHTYASLLFREAHRSNGTNASVLAASRLLGHHSPAFTLKIYLHLLEEDELDDASFLDEITSGSSNGSTRNPEGGRSGRRQRPPKKQPSSRDKRGSRS